MLSEQQISEYISQELKSSKPQEEKLERIIDFILCQENNNNSWKRNLNKAELLINIAEKEAKKAHQKRLNGIIKKTLSNRSNQEKKEITDGILNKHWKSV